MIVEKKKAPINLQCSECGNLVYPEEVNYVKPKNIVGKFKTWKFCESCYKKLFKTKEKG